MRRITKVKCDGERVQIAYEVERAGGFTDYHTVDSAAAPAPSFTKALEALAVPVCELCELPGTYAANMAVRGASFSYEGEGKVLGAVVTCLKPVAGSNSPLVLNSPHQTEEPLNEDGDPSVCMSEDMAGALYDLLAEAEGYLDGKRAQADLFDQPRQQAPAEAPEAGGQREPAAAGV